MMNDALYIFPVSRDLISIHIYHYHLVLICTCRNILNLYVLLNWVLNYFVYLFQVFDNF